MIEEKKKREGIPIFSLGKRHLMWKQGGARTKEISSAAASVCLNCCQVKEEFILISIALDFRGKTGELGW